MAATKIVASAPKQPALDLPVPIKSTAGGDIGPLMMVAYAMNKVGKTQFGASSGLKTLVLETDPQGQETLIGLGRKNVDYVQITEWEQVDPFFWMLKEGK